MAVANDEYVYGSATLGPSDRATEGDEPVPIMVEFVVLPREVATSLARLWKAMSVTTWGELRTHYPDVYADVCQLGGYARIEDDGSGTELTAPPDDDDPLDLEEVSLVNADGEWPPSPRVLMYGHLPQGLPDRLGTAYLTELGQMAVEFPDAIGPTLIGELEALGFSCVEDRELIEAIAEHELQQWGAG